MGGGAGGGGGGGGAGGGGQAPGREREEALKEIDVPDKDNVGGPDSVVEDPNIKQFVNEPVKTDHPLIKDMGNMDLAFDDPRAQKAFENFQKNPGLATQGGMPVDDIHVITQWTGLGVGAGTMRPSDAPFQGLGSDALSKQMWGTTPSTAAGKQFAKRLGESLDSVPKYQGQSYRTIPFEKGSNRLAQFEPGKTFTTKGFMGTSHEHTRISTPPSAKQIKDMKSTDYMHITVQSKSGHMLDRVVQTGEKEVLHRPGTKFMTTSKSWNEKRQVWDVRIKEI